MNDVKLEEAFFLMSGNPSQTVGIKIPFLERIGMLDRDTEKKYLKPIPPRAMCFLKER